MNDGIRLPLVCKRFRDFIQQYNLPVTTASSTEVEALKQLSKKNFRYDQVFGKLGSHLRKFTIDSNADAFEVDLIMKSIGKYCHNVKTMVVRLLYANNMKRLPKSLHNLTVTDFRAKCLNVSALTELEKLSVTSSDSLDEVKIYRPLKELHFELRLGDSMPDHSKINRITAMLSKKCEVVLHSHYLADIYFYAGRIHRISLNELNRTMNLKLFTINFFNATIEGIDPTKLRDTKIQCKCAHYAPVSMHNLYRFLNNYCGPSPIPATKTIRYSPETILTIEYEFDDCEHRHQYFEGLHLGLPICYCASVEVVVLLK